MGYAGHMAKWWLPWLFPVALALTVMITAISVTAAAADFVALCLVGLAALRARHLKTHPPDPELVHKPFWRF